MFSAKRPFEIQVESFVYSLKACCTVCQRDTMHHNIDIYKNLKQWIVLLKINADAVLRYKNLCMYM